MISRERLAEIRALTWEWNYEDCSDHQSAVDDLLADRDQLFACADEMAELIEARCYHCRLGPCEECPPPQCMHYRSVAGYREACGDRGNDEQT